MSAYMVYNTGFSHEMVKPTQPTNNIIWRVMPVKSCLDIASRPTQIPNKPTHYLCAKKRDWIAIYPS